MNSDSHKVPLLPITKYRAMFFLAVNDLKHWSTTGVRLTSYGNLSARRKKVKATHCENCNAIFVNQCLVLYCGMKGHFYAQLAMNRDRFVLSG